jgi:tripartite-type tricarboxylate transporter receptor subunit TctC
MNKPSACCKVFFCLVALAVGFSLAALCIASDYPDRTVTLIIPFDPGTSSDRAGRMIANLAEKNLGIKFSIVNKPGSAGAVGYTQLKGSKPDGYTLCFGTSTLATHKLLGNLPFDYRDVANIIIFQFDPCVISVNSKSSHKTLKSLIEEAREKPGQLTQATGAPGGILNVASLALEDAAKVDFRLIPAGGGGAKPAIQLGGGHVDTAMTSVGEASPQVDANNIRVLGVMADARVARWPDTPTMQEQGVDIAMGLYRGIIAPAGTPPDRLAVLHDAFKKAADTTEFQKFLSTQGAAYTYAGLENCEALFTKQSNIFKKLLVK